MTDQDQTPLSAAMETALHEVEGASKPTANSATRAEKIEQRVRQSTVDDLFPAVPGIPTEQIEEWEALAAANRRREGKSWEFMARQALIADSSFPRALSELRRVSVERDRLADDETAACSRCGRTLTDDEPVYLIFDANSQVTGRLCEECEDA